VALITDQRRIRTGRRDHARAGGWFDFEGEGFEGEGFEGGLLARAASRERRVPFVWVLRTSDGQAGNR
jgi:hypothetical protein